MRRPIIAGNWKMNNTKAEAEALITALKPLVKEVKGVDVVVCVPFTDVDKVKKLVKGSKIRVGAQNVSWARLRARSARQCLSKRARNTW